MNPFTTEYKDVAVPVMLPPTRTETAWNPIGHEASPRRASGSMDSCRGAWHAKQHSSSSLSLVNFFPSLVLPGDINRCPSKE